MKEPITITQVIRDAILNNTDRSVQFSEISKNLNTTRNTAKTLFFAFAYNATEDHLKALFLEGNTAIQSKPDCKDACVLLLCIDEKFYIIDENLRLGSSVKRNLYWISTFVIKQVGDHCLAIKNRYDGNRLWFENISNAMEYIQFVDADTQRHKGATYLSNKEDVTSLIRKYLGKYNETHSFQ